jgi:hypothetical protein
MDLLSGIGSSLISGLLGRPEIQTMVAGVVVTAIVGKLKELLKLVDENGVPADKKVLVQQLVAVLSFVVTAGDLALKGQLASLDPTNLVTFAVQWAMTHLIASGTHQTIKTAQGK